MARVAEVCNEEAILYVSQAFVTVFTLSLENQTVPESSAVELV